MPQAYVLGSPIGHSLSPAMHGAAYVALGLTDWSYAAHTVDESSFAQFVAGCGPEVRGLSLTMPLKEIAFTVAEPVSHRAELAGAINTLVRTESGWLGDNTDILGVIGALAPEGRVARGRHSGLLLGAGATGRSAVIALRELGCRTVTACARNPGKALDSLGPLTEKLDVELTVRELEAWPTVKADLAVSTLPPSGARAATDVLEAGEADLSGIRLLDVVYADWPTPLARAAMARGASVVSGLDMLAHQAVEQVELMTGLRPDWKVLLEAGQAACTG
ncbi:putative shikimate 5-dehydrogenase [Nostocoides australiense Ben110]|uniref:Putative shikimate 5-dehydrogenase n=1 Tax=Nostocoides australiense Ben110 TaxID=1193182 RepID=W6JV87_9MICO|nr:shikimate dehydrogenase [Tetrasphaera australiensis]MCA0292616.1 shikimate dehydrogenase [Actinomycetota bacterium]CCH72892.1 putative shikimate 5-dehydrogenase [Tetrasphaera australiensis Ben110]